MVYWFAVCCAVVCLWLLFVLLGECLFCWLLFTFNLCLLCCCFYCWSLLLMMNVCCLFVCLLVYLGLASRCNCLIVLCFDFCFLFSLL